MALGGSMLDNGSSVPRMEGEGLPEKPAILINPDEQVLEAVLARSQVIVDAVLGTGFDAGAVKEPFCGWIRCANEIETAAKLACDVPSGVSAQNGYGPHQTHVRFLADETLTMIVPKPGLSARECGTVHVAPLAYIEPYFV